MIIQKKNPLENTGHYYNANNRLFRLFGQGGGEGVIHQPLYRTGNREGRVELRGQEEMIIEYFKPTDGGTRHFLDLGCGVGSSMVYLAKRFASEVRITGITLSEVQAKKGKTLLEKSSMTERLTLIQGDYHQLPEMPAARDGVYAIESFIHSTEPGKFFREASGVLKSQGQLIVIDDFLRENANTSDSKASAVLENFKKYWLANALLTLKQTESLASSAGLKLVKAIDLSPRLDLMRPRDRAIRRFLPILKGIAPRWHYTQFLIGGDARQRAFEAGLLSYQFILFQK